jgi:uncharacterized protein (TIGR01244 family)
MIKNGAIIFFTGRTMKKLLILILLTVLINVQAQQTKETKTNKPLYTELLFHHENIFIGGQPEYSDFAAIKSAGFTKVINMRTPNEMKELQFHEDYLLKKADISYHLIPIGGKEFDYSPAKLTEFAQALESNNEKVLLHCRSGHRASQLWAAYLVKYKGKSPDDALALVKGMGWWPMPMEALLDKKLHVSIEK